MFAVDRRVKILTLGSMCFGLFVVMLDTTVVNLALPTIQRDLSADITKLQWIVDAFTLLLASLLLTGGTLGDIYGRKRAFLGGMGIFTAGSLLCALSPSVSVLIGGRAVQGVGAAIMLPATLAILTSTFREPKERAQAIGIWAGISGIALALGPAVGGVMVDSFGWQSIFYLNVPIGIIAVAMAGRIVRESRDESRHSLDLPGQALAAVGLASLTYAFIEANNYGWGSARIVSFFVVAVVALVGFGFLESRRKNPMLELGFFRNHTFLGANLVGLLVSFGFFGILFFLALFMQNVQGFTATEAGVRQLPSTLFVMVMSIVAGRIAGRRGARVPIVAGMLILAAGIMLFITVQADTPYSHYWWMLALTGIGCGLVMSPMTAAIMSTVPTARAGMASATSNTTRQVGGVFGIALLGSVVTHRFASVLSAELSKLDVPANLVQQIVASAQQGRSGGQMPSGMGTALIGRTVGQAFTTALHLGLWICGLVLVAGAIVGLVLVRGTSPQEQLARRATARAAEEESSPVPVLGTAGEPASLSLPITAEQGPGD